MTATADKSGRITPNTHLKRTEPRKNPPMIQIILTSTSAMMTCRAAQYAAQNASKRVCISMKLDVVRIPYFETQQEI